MLEFYWRSQKILGLDSAIVEMPQAATKWGKTTGRQEYKPEQSSTFTIFYLEQRGAQPDVLRGIL